MRAEGRDPEATHVARATLGLLALVTSILVLLGVLGAPILVDLLFGGFEGAKRELTVQLVRVLFPGIGILVVSAWCLGILNSHGRFFLSYAAPVAWNVTIIASTLLVAPGRAPADLTVLIAWAAVLGSILQVAVQVPSVRRFTRGTAHPGTVGGVKTVVRNFGPALLTRGVVQISAWVDMLIASFLGTGAVTALASAQMIGVLPVSLFGMSVSAAELPAMSRERGDDSRHEAIRQRLESGWRRIAFYVIPSAGAFLALGQVISGAVFQTGAFTARDSAYVWLILAGSALGLLATTAARLTSSAFFALGDTRTPFRFASVRMAVGVALGVLLGLVLPPRLGLDPRIGAAGLTLAGGIAGWSEFWMLRRSLARRIGTARFGVRYVALLWGATAGAMATGWILIGAGALRLGSLGGGIVVLGVTAGVYLILTWLLKIPEARLLVSRSRRGA